VPDFLKLKDALAADAQSANDFFAVANLPTGTNSLTALRDARDGTVFMDADSSGNNTFFRINTANAKALGLLEPDAPGEDASISFNSSVNFDFDPSDGISFGATDFIGVATHEIGHALGVTSGVDLIDIFTGDGPSADVDLNGLGPGVGSLNPFALFSAVDLFRRSDDSIAAGTDVLDLSTIPGAFFSIDGQPSDLLLETGSFNGSGQQASHFVDNLGLGIFDPTAAPGERLQISNNDLFVLDVIGFDLTFPCDFDIDGDCDPADLDILYENFGSGSGAFDVDGSGLVDADDIAAWLALASSPTNPFNTDGLTFAVGDLDFDGTVNSIDLGLLLNNFGDTSGLTYQAGNLDENNFVGSNDLGVLLNNFVSPTSPTTAVPEPSFPAWAILFLSVFVYSRQKN